MSELAKLIQNQLSGEALDMISKQIGGNQQQTAAAVSTALPMILQALNKNTNQPEGAQALANAVEKDHDGSLLNNLGDFVNNFQKGPGAGILKHVLGNKQNTAQSMIGNASGLNNQSSGQLMQILAPIVMAQLSKTKKESGLDASGLSNMLTNVAQQQEKEAPQAAGLINKFLDQDGDGKINDDLAQMGMKALGNFFKKR